MQAKLFREETAGIGHHTEDTDATREGCGFGNDIVGTATHIVSATGCQSAHGNDNGLFGFEKLDGTPHLLAGIGRTTAAIDAQHDGLDVFVVSEFVEVGNDFLSNDFCFLCEARRHLIDDASFSDIYGNLVVAFFLV